MATENFVIDAPEGVNLVSASFPRCPINMTLFTLRDAIMQALYHTGSGLSFRLPGVYVATGKHHSREVPSELALVT